MRIRNYVQSSQRLCIDGENVELQSIQNVHVDNMYIRLFNKLSFS